MTLWVFFILCLRQTILMGHHLTKIAKELKIGIILGRGGGKRGTCIEIEYGRVVF